MNQPKVSVIIPVYNTEKYLRECLDSVVNQTLRDIEIICVDDCSEDGSRAILKEYAARDERIRPLFYEKRCSASQARKDGVMMARGQYILFVDSDDALACNACEELAAEMDVRGVDMLHFGIILDAEPQIEESKLKFFERFSSPYTKSLTGRAIFNACFAEHKFRFNLWNKIYKTELCKKGFAEVEDGYFPKAQDMYAFFFLAWYAESFYGIEKKYYHYKYGRGITGGGGTVGLDTIQRYCTQFDVAQRCRAFLVEQNAWDTYKDVWEDMNRDLAKECINVWFKQLPAAEGPAGFDEIANQWGCSYTLQCMQKMYGNRISEAYEKMAGAKALIQAGICADPADTIVPDGFQCVVPVAFACNEKYAPYAGVAIQSIIENANPERFYRIYVLYSSLSEETIQLLEAYRPSQLSVHCLNVELLIQCKATKLRVSQHFSKEVYYRLVIPEIFGFYSQVIYLDCDLIVNRDIADILQMEMGNHLLAAVRNISSPKRREQVTEFFHLNHENYFNSGVLVINVRQWLEEDTSEKCFEILNTEPWQHLIFPDQDILNIVCRDRVFYLDPAWNYYWHMRYGQPDFIELCKPLAERIGEDFYILHFASLIKPWSSPELALSRYFWKYARNSFFYEIILKQNFQTKSIMAPRSQQARMIDTMQAKDGFTPEKNILIPVSRKLRGGIQCLRDNGAGYTFRRILYHIGLWTDEEAPKGPKNRPKLVLFVNRLLRPVRGRGKDNGNSWK